jgi:hypothetical protein
MLSIRIVLFSFIFIFGFVNQAKALSSYQVPAWSLGMGGVHMPFPRDGDIPTSNAAFLSHVNEISFELLNLEIKTPGLDDITKFQELPNANGAEGLSSLYGRPIQTGLDARLSILGPRIGFSGYTNTYLKSYLSNPLVPEWYIHYLSDYGLTVAFSTVFSDTLSAGIGLKRVTRSGGEVVLDTQGINDYVSGVTSTADILELLDDVGIGYGIDVSFLYKSPGDSSSIATVVWKDVGTTSFQKTSGDQNPPSIKDNLTLGLGYIVKGPGLDIKTGFEYRHILTSGEQIGKKLHAGIEVSLPLVDLRAGLSQGYSTFGAGLDLWIMRLEVAKFTEEFGVYPGQTPEESFQLSLTMDFSVDADFSMTSKSGKRRKLKQRR